jgi:hypothetical protein
MGIIETLAQKIGLQPQGTLQERKATYEKVLLEAMADGVLTQAEMDELDSLRKQLKLKDEDVGPLRMKAFQRALQAVKADGLFTPKEERDLEKIAAYLDVDGKTVTHNQQTLAKMRVLYEIHRGNLPLDEVPGLGLETGEQTHLSMPATYYAVRKDTRLLAPGIGQVIKAGAPYRMGAGRLNPLAEAELGDAVLGTLTLTSRRLMFNSGQHAFRLKFDKLLGITVFADGMLLEVDTGEPRVLVPGDRRELEVIFAILSRYLNPPAAPSKPGPSTAPGKPQPPSRPQPPRR